MRDHDGYYKFSPRSFQEFFYSRFLLSDCCRGISIHWSEGYFPAAVYRFIRDFLQSQISNTDNPPHEIHEIKSLVKWIVDEKQSGLVKANAIKCGTSPILG